MNCKKKARELRLAQTQRPTGLAALVNQYVQEQIRTRQRDARRVARLRVQEALTRAQTRQRARMREALLREYFSGL